MVIWDGLTLSSPKLIKIIFKIPVLPERIHSVSPFQN
jgi:hypothetical protein